MKIPPTVVVAILLLTGTLSGASDLSGTWDLEMTFSNLTSAGTCVFRQDNDALSGTCGAGSDRFAITGTIDGTTVSWAFSVKQDGAEGRMEFTGEVDAPSMTITGSCRVVEGVDGTFTMRKRR